MRYISLFGLNKLQQQINQINRKYTNINYGACGIFSYYLSIVLENNKIINRIVYTPEINTPVGAFRCDVKFNHIIIDIGSYYIDNNGIYTKMFGTIPLDRNKLAEMITEPRLWSNVFDWRQKEYLIQDINKIII